MSKKTESKQAAGSPETESAGAEDAWTLSPAEKQRLSAEIDSRRDDASHAMPDPVPAIEALARAQAAAALISLCQANGIGIAATGEGLIVYSNNRLWRTLAESLSRHAAEVARAMPGALGICSAEIRVVGKTLDHPPGPIEVVRFVPEPLPPWMGGVPESEQKEAWIVAGLKAASHHHTAGDPGWTPEQLDRARERLTETIQLGDQIESASNYRITVRKRGGATVEIARFDA